MLRTCLARFVFSCSGAHPDLPSFPTRRSSDLSLTPLELKRIRELGELATGALHGILTHPNWRGETEHNLAGAFSSTLQCRSEEHTSELQSHSDIVCRLLLEKKSTNTTTASAPA